MMISDLLFRLRAIFRRRSVEKELDDELRFHFEHEVEKLMRAGLTREEASRRARLSLGGMDQVKEECRDARGVSGLEAVIQDLRYGLRGLRRNPVLTLLATVTLSLGMAASAVVFSIFEAALLRPLPFRDADRLVELWETRLDRGIDQASFTEANFWDVRAQNHSFAEVAALTYSESNMTGVGPAEKVSVIWVTAGIFRALGVSPILGRDFSYDDLPVADIRSFQEVVSRSVAPQRFNAILLGVFSGLALLLATTGIYGVLSYSMSRRTSEIGLRLALGASASSILRMTMLQGMRPALLGIGLGAVGAWWLSGYLATLLFDIKPFDILTYAAVAALLLATALAACYLPSRRAMRIDPAVALRIE
jgi:hypothetical protein